MGFPHTISTKLHTSFQETSLKLLKLDYRPIKYNIKCCQYCCSGSTGCGSVQNPQKSETRLTLFLLSLHWKHRIDPLIQPLTVLVGFNFELR